MFKNATPINAAPAKKAGKPGKQELSIAGAEQLAMIDALEKTLKTLRGTVEAEVKAAAQVHFAAHIMETGQRPESIVGTEGGARVGLTLTRKRSDIALPEATVQMLREHGVEPVKTIVKPELYAFNPAYAADPIMTKVEKYLTKNGFPADLIVLQAEEAKYTCAEETFNAVVAKKLSGEVIGALSTIAASPRLAETHLDAILDFVRDMVSDGGDGFGEAATEAKALKLVKVAA